MGDVLGFLVLIFALISSLFYPLALIKTKSKDEANKVVQNVAISAVIGFLFSALFWFVLVFIYQILTETGLIFFPSIYQYLDFKTVLMLVFFTSIFTSAYIAVVYYPYHKS